ncbi:ketosteroid isomerase-related protein [Sphingobium sp. TCM1]|uniref:ketosteroid isomerase-related protein n=1 Tax=Sphingobium sp. TCM1 TaxID=453246 RepID=UPI0007F4601F|nr:ketosteroid isomerase-related protein [Sphingobium sp. TCM1]OAN56625.1 cytosolic protein [Sphingobium sp. TCM1]
MSLALLASYYEMFNAGDWDGMAALLTDDVLHEPSQGAPRQGREQFRAFLDHMNRCYRETVHDPVFMASGDGSRGAAEFDLSGTYLSTDGDLPPASGQGYCLRVGTFFAFRDGRIARVSNHYNLNDWLAQIGG